MEKKRLTFTKYIGSNFATQGVLVIVFTLPLFLSDSGDEDNISTQAVIGEAVHGLEGEEGESKDVLGPLPMFHQSVQ